MTPLTILKHHKRNFEKEAEIEVIFFDLSTSGFNHSESPPSGVVMSFTAKKQLILTN